MMRTFRSLMLLLFLLPGVAAAAGMQAGLLEWLRSVESELGEVARAARAGDLTAARGKALQVYLDRYEVIEGWYGAGGRHAAPALSQAIAAAEQSFHVLLNSTSTASDVERTAKALTQDLRALERIAIAARVPLYPDVNSPLPAQTRAGNRVLMTAEVKKVDALLAGAEAAFASGRRAEALKGVEQAYLEGFEPLESRLPGNVVGDIERAIHLQLRPALKGNASAAIITANFADLRGRLADADAFLARGGSFWFATINSFVIIVREGLEAVLLVGALLAYLSAAQASLRDRRRIWTGAGLGVVASLLTWVVAVTLIPLSGASRELVEGVTALVAVGVLLYVSHWLFQKTYIHDWKEYLRDHLGVAVSRGSAFAMMALAFAAVYREGFETVLFYQAMLVDAGGGAVLAGFVPGSLIIAATGYAIIRAGMKLPLKRVFAVTNSILLYLAVVFLGKGIYNLQESGAFSAHPIKWMPSHPALQQVFGFYPLVETLLAQVALGGVLGLTFLIYRRKVIRARQVRVTRSTALAT